MIKYKIPFDDSRLSVMGKIRSGWQKVGRGIVPSTYLRTKFCLGHNRNVKLRLPLSHTQRHLNRLTRDKSEIFKEEELTGYVTEYTPINLP